MVKAYRTHGYGLGRRALPNYMIFDKATVGNLSASRIRKLVVKFFRTYLLSEDSNSGALGLLVEQRLGD